MQQRISKISNIFSQSAGAELARLDRDFKRVSEDFNTSLASYTTGVMLPCSDAQKDMRRKLDAIRRTYRVLFYRQFRDMAAYHEGVQHRPEESDLARLMKDEAIRTGHKMLPLDTDAQRTFEKGQITAGYKQFFFNASPDTSPDSEAFIVVEEQPDYNFANVCLTSVPGSRLGDPTNFRSHMMKKINSDLSDNYPAEDIEYFIHIPPECDRNGEKFFKVRRLTGELLPLQAIPKAVVQNVADSIEEFPCQFKPEIAEHRKFILSF